MTMSKRLPKKQYFEMRLKSAEEAGLTQKAAYYRRRLAEINSPALDDVIRRAAAKHPSEPGIKRAMEVVNTSKVKEKGPFRTAEVNQYGSTPEQFEKMKKRISSMSYDERVKRAAKLISDSDGKVEQCALMHYLTDLGLTMTEYLEALNIATGGGVIRVALGRE